MATYSVNKRAVAKARHLIDAHQYRVRSRWADVQPRAAEQNAFLRAHGWAEYASWHLALTDGAPDETKARYAFVYGDFHRLHRRGLIACYYRAAEREHTAGHARRAQPAPPFRQVENMVTIVRVADAARTRLKEDVRKPNTARAAAGPQCAHTLCAYLDAFTATCISARLEELARGWLTRRPSVALGADGR